jgi:hypothetical protein
MKKILLFVGVLGLLAVPIFVFAQGPYLGLEYGGATGLGKSDVRLTVSRMINVSLGLLGTVSLVLILWAGFKWMTSGGNEEEAKNARKILIAATIGLAIILSAYSISNFVVNNLYKATTGFDYRE